ncbi:phage protease [Methylocystis parvus]|uniref:phage protease n=1 Tax=Methylocystis parvus TaxID=134 RepID=UPI003C7192A6
MRSRTIEELSLFAIDAPLPKNGSAPEWITIFPKIGQIKTRDGRSYTVDAEAIMRAFEADGLELPIDLNHATDTAMAQGMGAPAVGWITALKIERGALRGKVDWGAKGKEALAAREYRYVSPSFWHTAEGDGNKTTRLKAVALVTAPALGQQQALASAQGVHGSARSAALAAAETGELIYGVVAPPVPRGRSLPDWVDVFPALGFVETFEEHVFYIDGKSVVDNFAKATRGRDEDYREFPVGLDHRAERAFEAGEDFSEPPLGYVVDLRISGGRLEAKIKWEREAESAFAVYAAVSPAFFVEPGGKVKRLKSLSLVRRARNFVKARALGNDVARQERGYQAPKLSDDAGQMAAAPGGDAIDIMAEYARSRALSEGELLLYTTTRLETEYKRAGLSTSRASADADALVRRDPAYALQQLQEWGQSSTESAKASRALDPVQRLDEERRQAAASNIEAQRQGRIIAEEAQRLVANAAAEGLMMSFSDAVAVADARLSASGGAVKTGDGADEATISALVVEGLKNGARFSRNDAKRLAQLMAEGALGGKHLDELEQATIVGVKAHEIRMAALQSGHVMTEGGAVGEANRRLGITARAPATLASNAVLRSAPPPVDSSNPFAIVERANALQASAEAAGYTLNWCEAVELATTDAAPAGAGSFASDVAQLLTGASELVARTANAPRPVSLLDAIEVLSGTCAHSRAPSVAREANDLVVRASALMAEAEETGRRLDWCAAVQLADAGETEDATPQRIAREAHVMAAASGGSLSYLEAVRKVADALAVA